MSNTTWLRVVLGLAISFVFLGSHGFAQTSMTGEWTAKLRTGSDAKINLNFQRHTDRGVKNQIGQSYDLADLQGLSRQQLTNGGPVKFSIVREAGRIDCEGVFQNGKGSGTFRFTGSESFVSAMKSRGFNFEQASVPDSEDPQDNKLFAATALNITTALADDLASGGFGKLRTEDLFKAAIFKVDSNFKREMSASGFPNLAMEDLVKARIFQVDASFVGEVSQMGLGKGDFEELVKLRIFKVTPEYVNEVRNEGLSDLSIEDLVKMRIFKIDSAFIRQAKADGVPLEVERLVQRRIGVARN